MGRCNCSQATCQCVLQTTETIEVGGAGTEGSPYVMTTIPEGVAPTLLSTDAKQRLELGTDGLLYVKAPWTLYSSTTPVANVGPTSDLANINVPGLTLVTAGDRLVFRAMLVFASVAENAGFEFRYGGTLAYIVPAAAHLNGLAYFEGELFRTGPATQDAVTRYTYDPTPFLETNKSSLAENNAVAEAFQIVALSGGAGENGAITLDSLSIDVFPI